MPTQTFLTWTVAPNGVTKDNKNVRASIVISPIVARQQQQPLPISAHPWFANWPQVLRAALPNGSDLTLRVGKRGDTNGRPLAAKVDALPASLPSPTGHGNMWQDLFAGVLVGKLPPNRLGEIVALGELDAFKAQQARLRGAIGDGVLGIRATDDPEASLLRRIRGLGRPPASRITTFDATTGAVNTQKEFHARVASFAGYKSVARELGLVLDVHLQLDATDIDWIRVEPPTLPPLGITDGYDLPVPRCPRTLVEVEGNAQTPSVFRALPAVGALRHGIPVPPGLPVKGFGTLTDEGLLDLDPKGTEFGRWDPVKTASHQDTATPRLARSAGDQVIVMSEGSAAVLTAWNARANALKNTIGDIELFADDLVRGMAIDLAEVENKTDAATWLSLCRRHGTHWANVDGAPGLTESEDEAPLELGELVGNQGDRFTPHVVFRLDGWSLSCSRPDRAHDGGTGETSEPLKSELVPPDHSLPRMRYGKRYLCRARAIDLAGHDITTMSRAPERANDRNAIGQYLLDIPFDRVSPVPAPIVVAPRKYAQSKQDWPSDPQSPRNIAVGYVFKPKPGDPDGHPDDHRASESRWVLPPAGTLAVAEFEGSLDEESDADAYEILKRVDNGPPELMPTPTRIEYLADPFASGVVFEGRPELRGGEVFFDGIPGSQGATTPISSDWETRLDKHRPIGLKVAPAAEANQPDPSRELTLTRILETGRGPGSPEIAALTGRDQPPDRWSGNDGITFYVRRGKRHRIAARCWALDEHHAVHGFLDVVRASGLFGSGVGMLDAPAGRALRGDLATPGTTIDIVHPIDKPLFHPRLFPKGPQPPLVPHPSDPLSWLAPREFDALDVKLAFSALVHAGTTGQVDVVASWDEVSEGDEAHERALVPVVCIVATRDTRTVDVGYFAQSGMKVLAIHARQVFTDHKCRFLTYQLRAATAFPEYYTPADVAAQAHYGDLQRVVILATRPPQPPSVRHIVPTFTLVDDDARHHHRRVGLRLHLSRDWYSSGDGELLAVLVRPKPASGALDLRVREACTIWGSDPIRGFDTVADSATSVVVTDSDKVAFKIERGAERGLDATLHVLPTNFDITHYVDGKPVHERICDIRLEIAGTDAKAAYLPFVRLALARHQPNAVAGAKLSDVVFATFVQLPAERTVTIVDAHSPDLRIDVTGPGPKTNEMWCRFVKEGERPIPLHSPSAVTIESSDVPLLVGSRDAGWQAGTADGAWSFTLPKPASKSRLVIIEREKIANQWIETAICNINY